MAALGAGAGAFEGDKDRAERSLRARGLGLEKARMEEGARQFDVGIGLRREQQAQDAERSDADRAQQQSNADRAFAANRSDAGFNRQQTLDQDQRQAKKDEWQKALDEQNMARQKQEMEFASAKFNQWKTLADQEREELNQRKLLGQTGMASLMRLARDNGGVAPLKTVQAVGQELGLELEGAFFDKDGLFVVNAFKQDEQGQKVAVPNFFPPPIQAQMMRAMPGIFGEEAAKSLETSVADTREHGQALERDKARYDSYLQRDDAKPGIGAKAQITAMAKRLDALYEELEYAATPEEKADLQSKIDQYSKQIEAVEGGGGGGQGAAPAAGPQADLKTRASQIKTEVVRKYGNTPRAREEYERLMRMSMQGGR